jgi:long-chain acyl-CoA synthetase
MEEVLDAALGDAVRRQAAERPGAEPDAAGVIARCGGQIAGCKAPKSVDFVDAIPRSAAGRTFAASCAIPSGPARRGR